MRSARAVALQTVSLARTRTLDSHASRLRRKLAARRSFERWRNRWPGGIGASLLTRVTRSTVAAR